MWIWFHWNYRSGSMEILFSFNRISFDWSHTMLTRNPKVPQSNFQDWNYVGFHAKLALGIIPTKLFTFTIESLWTITGSKQSSDSFWSFICFHKEIWTVLVFISIFRSVKINKLGVSLNDDWAVFIFDHKFIELRLGLRKFRLNFRNW